MAVCKNSGEQLYQKNLVRIDTKSTTKILGTFTSWHDCNATPGERAPVIGASGLVEVCEW